MHSFVTVSSAYQWQSAFTVKMSTLSYIRVFVSGYSVVGPECNWVLSKVRL